MGSFDSDLWAPSVTLAPMKMQLTTIYSTLVAAGTTSDFPTFTIAVTDVYPFFFFFPLLLMYILLITPFHSF
jgi:hypothetical protein